jgi:hypothetical protein
MLLGIESLALDGPARLVSGHQMPQNREVVWPLLARPWLPALVYEAQDSGQLPDPLGPEQPSSWHTRWLRP